MSAVHSSRYEALRKFREHSRSYSSSRLRLEQLLRIFRALQTSRDEPTRWTHAMNPRDEPTLTSEPLSAFI